MEKGNVVGIEYILQTGDTSHEEGLGAFFFFSISQYFSKTHIIICASQETFSFLR